ncbi:MAG: hypothetical protein Q7J16_09840 [Candidatus Cloacimonadales bacterium]|nr:hypothetical protein [Candidatus Cloacimonadales bacterium]
MMKLNYKSVQRCLTHSDIKTLTAWTLGKSGTDFQIASKIAKHFNLQHKISSELLADCEEFKQHAHYLSFCMNGDTTALRAINKIEVNPVRNAPKVIGIYGTIATGKNIVGSVDYDSYKKIMFAKKHRIQIKSTEVALSLKKKLDTYIDELSEIYPKLYQEMFYLRERCGTWGGVVFNSTWNTNYVTPFEDIIALQKGLSLPEKLRRKTKSQHVILKRISAYLYWLPINQNIFNNDYTSFLPEKMRVKAHSFIARINGKWQQISHQNKNDIVAQRTDAFHKYFSSIVEPLLLREDSIAIIILSKKEIENLCNTFNETKRNAFICAQLYSMELWKNLIEEMSILREK